MAKDVPMTITSEGLKYSACWERLTLPDLELLQEIRIGQQVNKRLTEAFEYSLVVVAFYFEANLALGEMSTDLECRFQ